MAFNLYCDGTPGINKNSSPEEQLKEMKLFTVSELFCIVKIEVYTDYKEAVRELIGKYKLKNLNGFRITDTEPGGGCIVDGAYVKDIIKAELYMEGENRADIMQDILPMTENEKLLSYGIYDSSGNLVTYGDNTSDGA